MHTKSKNHSLLDQDLQPVTGRNIAALLNPRPLALIGCTVQETSNFTTVAWITPLSHEPALLGFALRSTSKTFQMIQETGCFSVNTCDSRLLETVRLCGNTSGHNKDKETLVPHTLHPYAPHTNGAPQIRFVPFVKGALSVFACQVDSIQQTGDHQFITAKIDQAFSRCLLDEQKELLPQETLLCLQRDNFVQVSQKSAD